MADDTIKIKIEVDAREAQANASRLRTLLHTDLSDAADRFHSRFLAGFQQIGTILGGVAVGTAAVGAALVHGAAQAEQHARAVTALGSAYAQVQAATMGTVTAQEALRAQQALIQSGLHVSGDELAAITRRARDYALATGTETPQAIDQLVDALRNGEQEGLARFNLSLRNGENTTRGFHRVLGELGQQFRERGPEARTLAEELAQVSANTTNLGGSFAALVTHALGLGGVLRSLNETLHDLGETADHVSRLDRQRQTDDANLAARERLTRVANSAPTRLRTGGANLGLGNVNRFTAAQANALADRIERDNRETGVTLASGGTIFGTAARGPATPSGPIFSGIARTLRGEHLDEYDLGLQGMVAGFLHENAPHAAAPERAGRTNGSVASAGGSNELAQARAELQRARAEADRIGAPLMLERAQRGETVVQWTHRMASGQQSLNQAWSRDTEQALGQGADMARAAAANDNDQARDQLFGGIADNAFNARANRGITSQSLRAAGTTRGNQLDALERSRRGDLGAQLSDRMESLAPAAARTQSVMQNMADTTVGAFSKMATAAGGFFEALMNGQDAGEAFKKMIHSLMESIAVESTVKALLAAAEGVFRLVRSYGADQTGTALLANAAMWAGVAAATGTVAALTVPSAPATAVPSNGLGGSAAPSRGATVGGVGDGGSRGATVINVTYSGTIYSREHASNEVVAMINDAVERGVRPRLDRAA